MPSDSDGNNMSAKDEWKKISSIQAKNTSLRLDKKYFVISKLWYSEWKDYATGITSEKPGKIDNTPILTPETKDKNNPQLQLNLQEDVDYIIISEKEWDYLHDW